MTDRRCLPARVGSTFFPAATAAALIPHSRATTSEEET